MTLTNLAELSRQIGGTPLLAQGAGGNTSMKVGELLWVKASGKWLADAEREPIFVPVRLSGVRNRVAAGEADPVTMELADGGPPGLLPSIETTLHALLPHQVVVHVHCIRTLAWAVRRDGRQKVAERLEGLPWEWLDYCRPGLTLTTRVAEVLATRTPDIFILANHGLVIGGDSVVAARRLLDEVTSRLDQVERETPAADTTRLTEMADGLPYAMPAHAESHQVALDPIGLRTAAAGSLYPDHVVFLGHGLTIAGDRAQLMNVAGLERPPAMVAVPGAGLVARTDLSRGAQAMLMAQGLLAVRVDDSTGIRHLSVEEEAELSNWDAEKYRIALARG